jgi:hypothetical protein
MDTLMYTDLIRHKAEGRIKGFFLRDYEKMEFTVICNDRSIQIWTVQDIARMHRPAVERGHHPIANPNPDTNEVLKIWEKLCEKYQHLETLIQDTKVVYGLAQSGKTEYILGCIWGISFVQNEKAVLVLMNSLDSREQLCTRDVINFNRVIYGVCEDLFIEDSRKYQLMAEGFSRVGEHRSYSSAKNIFLVAMGNISQLRKMKSVLRENNVGPYRMVIDEADTLIKKCIDNDLVATGKCYEELVADARGVIKVTATTFAVLNQDAQMQGTVQLPIPESYRGVGRGIEVRNFVGGIRKDTSHACDVIEQAVTESQENPSGYKCGLVNVNENNTSHESLAIALKQRNMSYRIFIFDTKDGSQMKEVEWDYSISKNTRMLKISDFFERCEVESAAGLHTTNIIIAGKKAGRAVSFRPNPPQEGEPARAGGLSFQVYDCCDNTHCATILQAIRLSGKYATNYPIPFLYVRKEIEQKILGELSNLKDFAEVCDEVCDTRNALEGVRTIFTGKHDRASVDDTICSNHLSVFQMEFDTLEEALALLPDDFCRAPKVMTGEVQYLDIDGFDYSSENRRGMRQKVQDALPDHLRNRKFHVAWNEAYYNRLFNLEFRYADQINDIVFGDAESTGRIPYVVWKDEYRVGGGVQRIRETLTHGGLSPDHVYWFRTTKNKIKVYIRDMVRPIKIGKLTHT